MVRVFFIFLFCCVCFACKRSKNKDDSVVRITIPELRNDVWMDMSEIIDTVVYIPLVTSDSCLLDINMLRKLEYYKGKYYCFVFTQGLYIFNSDGSFCNKISFGRAPGELFMKNSHKAFWIDRSNDKLVFPGWYKLHFYDLEGHFISTQNLKAELVPAQAIMENGQFWFYFFGNMPFNKKGDGFHFYSYDFAKGVQKGYLPAHPLNKYGEGGFGSGSCILAYSPLANDTIYKIDQGCFFPFYYIDFGKNKFPDHLPPSVRYDVRKRKSDYVGIIDDVVTNDTILYFTFSRNRVRQEVYYFNSTGKIFTGARHRKDCMLYIPFGATMAYDKGYFVALADSYRLMQQAPGIADKLRLKEDDNPVIVLYRLKQN